MTTDITEAIETGSERKMLNSHYFVITTKILSYTLLIVGILPLTFRATAYRSSPCIFSTAKKYFLESSGLTFRTNNLAI